MSTEFIKVRVAISYSHDSDKHKNWVKKLADDLESKGINVILDQKHLHLGNQLTSFMQDSISKAERVLCIMTPNYKKKTDNEEGGVGYEYSIIRSQILHNRNKSKNKFIPILREGSKDESCPEQFIDYYYLEFKEEDNYEEKLDKLLHEILSEKDNESS